MKLVTFFSGNGARRSGALIDDGHRIVDLQALHVALRKTESPTLVSVLAIAVLPFVSTIWLLVLVVLVVGLTTGPYDIAFFTLRRPGPERGI